MAASKLTISSIGKMGETYGFAENFARMLDVGSLCNDPLTGYCNTSYIIIHNNLIYIIGISIVLYYI